MSICRLHTHACMHCIILLISYLPYLPTYVVAHSTRWMAASVLLSASILCIWRTTASTWRRRAIRTSSPFPLCCSTPACSARPASRRSHKLYPPHVLLLPPAMTTTAAVATTEMMVAVATMALRELLLCIVSGVSCAVLFTHLQVHTLTSCTCMHAFRH